MTEILPLLIYPQPDNDMLPKLRAAKAKLDVPFKVIPGKAIGGVARVIAMGTPPNFICDYALVRDIDNQMSIDAAVRWALDEVDRDPRAVYVEDMLAEYGYTEIFEKVEGVHFG